MHALLLVLVLVCLASAVAACPGFYNKDGGTTLSARQLATARKAAVHAGGSVVLDACEILPGAGHIPFEPTAAIHYGTVRGGGNARDLEFRAKGTCDTVLLIRTPSDRWIFEGGEPGGAKVRLRNPEAGRYEVWVGAYDPFGCDADLELQAFR